MRVHSENSKIFDLQLSHILSDEKAAVITTVTESKHEVWWS